MKHDYTLENYMIWKVCGIPTPVLKAKLAGCYEGKKLDYPSKSLLSKQGGNQPVVRRSLVMNWVYFDVDLYKGWSFPGCDGFK